MTKKKQSKLQERAWKHNSFRGCAKMMEVHLKSMMASDSVSAGTKYFVQKMMSDVKYLQSGLETRIDP